MWRALLEKTDELSKRRMTMSELLLTQVSEVGKYQKRTKEANFKKVSEWAMGIECNEGESVCFVREWV